jgi:hypothetical protein
MAQFSNLEFVARVYKHCKEALGLHELVFLVISYVKREHAIDEAISLKLTQLPLLLSFLLPAEYLPLLTSLSLSLLIKHLKIQILHLRLPNPPKLREIHVRPQIQTILPIPVHQGIESRHR